MTDVSIEEQHKRATAKMLGLCIKEAFGDHPALAITVAHLKRRAEGKAEIRLEFDHAGADGTLLHVEFITPPSATPKMLGQACSVLLAHCMVLTEGVVKAETVLADIVRLAREHYD